MGIEVEDLVGLNRTQVHDMPIVDGHETARRLLGGAATGRPLSVAGLHHSQGGHTLLANGRVLLTEAMNEHITVDAQAGTVTVDAGATWSQVHRALFVAKLCPRVHQSSPHFSVGGSISVNCHGRDPHAGPISTTVLSLTVLCGDGKEREASEKVNPDLFRAVIGGYGSCGLILRATLRVMPDEWLVQTAAKARLIDLGNKLRSLAAGADAAMKTRMFYAWLCCVPGTGGPAGPHFYDDVLTVEYTLTKAVAGPDKLEEHSWGISEMMRAAWSAARVDRGMRVRIWQELLNEFLPSGVHTQPQVKRRINWMRASVDFSSQRDKTSSDILVEYFLPVDTRIEERIGALGAMARKYQTNVLSTTVRLVQADSTAPYLAYCARAPMVCLAMDVAIGIEEGPPHHRKPDEKATTWARESTRYVLDQGGSYYLPYVGFADRKIFREAYGKPRADWQQQEAMINRYNKDRRLWNGFLEQYFGPDVP